MNNNSNKLIKTKKLKDEKRKNQEREKDEIMKIDQHTLYKEPAILTKILHMNATFFCPQIP